MGLFVASSRPERKGAANKWTVLYSPNGKPPDKTDLDPNYLPSSLVNSLCDPVLVVVHGYNNRESDAFGLYAALAGLGKKKEALAHYGFTGTVMGFDWPTGYLNSMSPSAQLGLYASDLNQAKTNGAPAFGLFLDRLTNALSGKSIRVNVMAHSMGNFVMTRALMGNPALAGRLTNLISFAPDILQTDPELPGLVTAADSLTGQWNIFWAQSDMILMTASNWGNILMGTETYGQERLGQAGLRPKAKTSAKVKAIEADEMLSQVGATSYNDSVKHWRYSALTHCAYARCPEFLQAVADCIR